MLEFCEGLSARASFPHKGLVEIGWVNSGLGGEFPKTDFVFLDGLSGSRKGFGGLLLFLLKGVDCGLESGD
jgi:hypothetical protein